MHSVKAGNQLLDLSTPKIMGILNLTSDSFFDGGRFNALDKALERAKSLLNDGADIIDLGAYSTRPGAEEVSPKEEITRLVPAIEAISKEFPQAIISIDTFRAEVARATVESGAHMINDVSGGTLDALMFETIAQLDVPYILMHMRGTPKTMQQETEYEDMVRDISLFLGERIAQLRQLGVKDIILDPGFGFAKTVEQNYMLLDRLEELHVFGLPILGAISRKSMIYKKLGTTPADALNGTTVLNTILLMKGVQMLRVHDVTAAKEAVLLTESLSHDRQRFSFV